MMRRGSPSRRPIAVADTASGGATIAPRVSAAASVSSGTVLYATKPTANVVASGRPTASSPIGPEVLSQPDVAALQARRPQQRRQQHVEHEFGLELDVLETGDRARGQAGDHQRQRGRHVISACQRGQQDRHHQHCKQGAMHLAKPPRSSSLSLVSMLKRSRRGRDWGHRPLAGEDASANPRTCSHLAAESARAGDEPQPRTPGQCEECAELGENAWAHLRMCLTCGHVGCCDSSPHQHASEHFHRTGHPVMRSVEPGEDWRWCYIDVRVG